MGILLVRLSIWFLNEIGHEKTLALGRMAGNALYCAHRRMKAKVLHNLVYAYGDGLSRGQLLLTCRNVMKNLAQNWFELLLFGGPAKAAVASCISIEGEENLKRALSRGRGVIAVSAHLGNYPILAQQFTMRGYDFMMVIRNPKNRVISAVYTKGREFIGLASIFTRPEKTFFRQALRVLKNNGVLCLIADENKRHGGIFVDFFGHPASTAPGPAALALRTGAPVVPLFLARTQGTAQKIIIEPELDRPATDNPDRAAADITARFTAIIEKHIRRDPAQWVWTNWRWRTQPWGQSGDAKIKKKNRLKRLRKAVCSIKSGTRA